MLKFSLVSTSIYAQQKGKCPFGFDSSDSQRGPENLCGNDVNTCFNSSDTVTAADFSQEDYKRVAKSIRDLYEEVSDDVRPNHNPRGKFVACLVRTAGHDFMDFRKGAGRGGSDGCINFDDPDNAGISRCLTEFRIPSAYECMSDRVSVADFLVIAAEVAASRIANSHNSEDFFAEGTLAKTFLDGFKFGRRTTKDCDWNVGLMPDPQNSCGFDAGSTIGLKQIFAENIYAGHKNPWSLIAAISGAHTVGGASVQASGFQGTWSDLAQSGTFDNSYFKGIMLGGWKPELNVSVKRGVTKNQWKISDKTRDDPHRRFMLDSDLCLAY